VIEGKRSWRIAITSAILNIVGMPLDAAFWWTAYATTPVWHIASMGVSLTLLVALIAARHTRRVAGLSSAAFVANNATIVVALWQDAAMGVVAAAPWVPFQPHKLGALAVALLAPPRIWSGAVSVALFVGSAVLQWMMLGPQAKARAPAEPWAILAFGTFAAGIYAYRIYTWRKEQRLADALAEARIAERLSRIVLALQDLANTPLQTLELTSALLADRGAAPTLIERMQRALARLRDLNRIMAHYSPTRSVWQGQASLDSGVVIPRDQILPHDRLADEMRGPPPGAG
jgi:hypothetical protein